jgi:Short C-terminal domain
MELGGGGLIARRAAMRMRTRQQYRTMARMERRRSAIQSRMGMRQDFGRGEPVAEAAPAAEPDYTQELEKLAELREKGVISDADFEAKKKQILGL